MEQIIVLIIMLLLSSLFKGKGKKEQAPQKGAPKPFTASSDDTFKKLKEMSKEMMREMQQEVKREKEPPSRQTPPIVSPEKPKLQRKPVKAEQIGERKNQREKSQRESHRGRLSAHGGQIEQPTAFTTENHLLPKTEDDLLKGIIFSEILSPPKSKR
ncbi:hypothetical protein [Sporosarcina sp. HYO08]|uniref:hypothetical protein n=1 Tax=Sporosarcina sp. HYO08 TaxID=1759557 RepID=UPI0007933D92|nr:hypothetical protein [Sporosarcina sp. HYO08]KXH87403.1 hypothetical protein AU377_02195 [Sporosarcina sp. HYO08]